MRKPFDFTHTPLTDAIIRSGYDASAPIIDIANTLGVTRNVVIGRARRLGLTRPWRTELGRTLFQSDTTRRERATANITASQRIRRQREREVNTAHKNSVEG